MTTFPRPTIKEMRAAFKDHGVVFVEQPGATVRFRNGDADDPWFAGLRAATEHHTAGVNSLTWLMNSSGTYPFCNALVNNGKYNGKNVDGRAQILSWGSVWHSGWGGPWKGIAAEDSLHLVSFGIENESRGTLADMTDAMLETNGRMLAAFVQLGMPIKNIHRHADWTDATGPVTGPLRSRPGWPNTTKGRKIDTRQEWYPTKRWVDLAKKYEIKETWDGNVPQYDRVVAGQTMPWPNRTALWRVQCRLYDLGFRAGPPVPPPNGPKYPTAAITKFQKAQGWAGSGKYNKKTHAALFKK